MAKLILVADVSFGSCDNFGHHRVGFSNIHSLLCTIVPGLLLVSVNAIHTSPHQ